MIRVLDTPASGQRAKITVFGGRVYLGAVETITNHKSDGSMSDMKTRPGDGERLVVSPRRACYALDCGTTHLYDLINKGELESFRDGRSRKITVESINRYIAKRLTTDTSKTVVPRPRGRQGNAAGAP